MTQNHFMCVKFEAYYKGESFVCPPNFILTWRWYLTLSLAGWHLTLSKKLDQFIVLLFYIKMINKNKFLLKIE